MRGQQTVDMQTSLPVASATLQAMRASFWGCLDQQTEARTNFGEAATQIKMEAACPLRLARCTNFELPPASLAA